MSNRLYFPIVGGTPVLTRLLGHEFVRLGHEVKLVVGTPGDKNTQDEDESFEVLRVPSTSQMWALADWADILFQIEVSVKFNWPFILTGKPFVTSNQTHCSGLVSRLQKYMAFLGHPTSISQHIQQQWNPGGTILGNPYDNKLFCFDGSQKDIELLFVGRLIEDKGITDLLEALAVLKQEGQMPELWIVGDHVDQGQSSIPKFEAIADDLGVRMQVHFVGSQNQAQVAQWMKRSRVLVVPSRWSEPFGIVALEGLGCGCQLVVSEIGGLVEASGNFGYSFKNGDVRSLATSLMQALRAPALEISPQVEAHLKSFELSTIAERYLHLFEEEIQSRRRE